jgi:LacI family transcriptional regulator
MATRKQNPPRTRPAAPARAATIVDVARAAGVSVATVSRVVNRNPNVTAATRRRIEAVVTRLRYVPDTAARSLVTRRSHMLGVVLPDLHGEFFSELIRGIDAGARERRLHLLVSSSHDDAAEMAAAVRAMHGRVEGLLVLAPQLDGDAVDLIARGTPAVFINTRITGAAIPAISIDSYGGARAMVRHLVSRGHRSIAHLAGPADNFDSHERERGYRDELAASLPGARARVLRGDFSEAAGAATGRALAADPRRPDAVFAANDMMAIGCMTALEAVGLAVPRALAVTGFDDIPLAAYVRPALTTMRVPIFELGRGAVRRLADAIADTDGAPPAPSAYEPELVIRDSCGSAARPTPRRDGGSDADVRLAPRPRRSSSRRSRARKKP